MIHTVTTMGTHGIIKDFDDKERQDEITKFTGEYIKIHKKFNQTEYIRTLKENGFLVEPEKMNASGILNARKSIPNLIEALYISYDPKKGVYTVNMPEDRNSDIAHLIGLGDFDIGTGEGRRPLFIMVRKPDGTMQFGKRDIRDAKHSNNKKVGYWDIEKGNNDYLEIY